MTEGEIQPMHFAGTAGRLGGLEGGFVVAEAPKMLAEHS